MFDDFFRAESSSLETSQVFQSQSSLFSAIENSLSVNKSFNSSSLDRLLINNESLELADLTIDNLSVSSTGIIGRQLRLNYHVKNQGNATSASSSLNFFLSKDQNLDTTDTLLGTFNIAALDPNAQQAQISSISLNTSLNLGDYYLIAQVDANDLNLENDETNNLWIKPLTLTQSDLVIESLQTSPIATIGETLTVDYTIKNQGTARARITKAAFFLSQDNIIDKSDLLLGTNVNGDFLPGSSQIKQVILETKNIVQEGNYYLLIRADYGNFLIESNEENNSLSVPITLYPKIENTNHTYDQSWGYGTVNAAAAVAQTLGETPFAEVANLGGQNWGADLIKAPEVWATGYTGQGVVVAVLDTGIAYNHPDLSQNIWQNQNEIVGNGIDDDLNGFVDDYWGWNFANSNNNTLDVRNHGTHVAGIIAGANNDFGVTGIAYDAKIMPVKVIPDQGSGSYSSVIQGIYYAVDNGADVINMSLAGSADVQELKEAIAYASRKGVIVVSAAGNSNGVTPSYPGSYALDDGLVVGAVDQSNKRANFSSRAGDNPNMAYVNAPGVNIYSTLANNGYGNLSGTSMATPHVAGVVALMLSANPDLTDEQIRQILTQTATSLA